MWDIDRCTRRPFIDPNCSSAFPLRRITGFPAGSFSTEMSFQPIPPRSPQPRAFEQRLLGGETGGVMLGAVALAPAVADLLGAEHPLDEFSVFGDQPLHPPDFNQIDSDSLDHGFIRKHPVHPTYHVFPPRASRQAPRRAGRGTSLSLWIEGRDVLYFSGGQT